MTFDGELLVLQYLFPCKVTSLRKRPHFIRRPRKAARARPKTPFKKLSIRAIVDRLEFTDVNAVLTDKRFNLASAQRCILISGEQPIVGRVRLKPLCERAAGPALVGRRAVVHKILDQLAGFAIPDRQWKRFAHALFRCSLLQRQLACNAQHSLWFHSSGADANDGYEWPLVRGVFPALRLDFSSPLR